MKSIIALMTLLPSLGFAQQCFTKDLNATTPLTRFSVNADGTVVDNTTGIMWMRCSLGQSWQQSTSSCSGGLQQITWQQALKAASTATFAGYSDWQLPSVKELTSIVERQCVDPAINMTVFPLSSAENYWSNTSGIDMADHAWGVAFYSGKNNLKSKQADLHVRFMRYQN